jgi:hypothetical protein
MAIAFGSIFIAGTYLRPPGASRTGGGSEPSSLRSAAPMATALLLADVADALGVQSA